MSTNMTPMATTPDPGAETSVAAAISRELPGLRRHARALTGSQTTGDAYASATLEAILAEPGFFSRAEAPRIALFRAFHLVWTSSGAPVARDGGLPPRGIEARAQAHMANLTPHTREVLLLHTIEEMTFDEIAAVMRLPAGEVAQLHRIALREMENSIRGRVMIIEDESLIAMDLSAIVTDLGHEVTGIARTRDRAVELAARIRPDLILADIHLADASSGIDAVNRILADLGEEVPVIFITAYPNRLLTGEAPEPAFLIAKPFTEEQVRSAVSQAMFFASTETLA